MDAATSQKHCRSSIFLLLETHALRVSQLINSTEQSPSSFLRGVVVSVLASGPKGRVFKPGRGDGFLRAKKIHSTSSFGW
jgi:hypothetical protein